MPPITNRDLKKTKIVNRTYRNRRIGDVLKELHLTEGRATGFPKIYHALQANGSPLPEFETDDRNSFFHATIRVHEAFENEELFVACNQLATRLATKSRQYFDRVAFKPAQTLGLIEPAADSPMHSPKTIYRLTKLGLALVEKLG